MLIGSKAQNYDVFKQVMELFVSKEHLDKDGLIKILNIDYSGTDFKNRKLNLNDYFNSIKDDSV